MPFTPRRYGAVMIALLARLLAAPVLAAVVAAPPATPGNRLQAQAIYHAIEHALDTLPLPADRRRTIFFIRHNAMPHGEFPTVNEATVCHAAKALLGETGLTPALVGEVLAALH